jgi:hypothetical protein
MGLRPPLRASMTADRRAELLAKWPRSRALEGVETF